MTIDNVTYEGTPEELVSLMKLAEKVVEDKPYVYKVGDIFGYKDDRQGGRIIPYEVSGISGSALEFYDVNYSETNTIYAGSNRLTLICPAESRVDTL